MTEPRRRARDTSTSLTVRAARTGGTPVRDGSAGLRLAPGILATGPLNDITDVAGVRVGHFTLIEGDDIRTGVTAILPHGGNIYQDKVPSGLAVGNGFGKLMGSTQLAELGEIETPILLTNTLAVPRAAEALIDWTLSQPGNEKVLSVNPIVGETNDGKLNNIRARALTVEHMLQAIHAASAGPVSEGCVGAGTGTVCFGWKGGIGTSSRVLPDGFILGVLVQSNFGGVLLGGSALHLSSQKDVSIQEESADLSEKDHPKGATHFSDGSIMIVLATDASLSDRNLTRLARRGLAGLALTGADMSNGSGDYVIAFSTHEAVRRTPERRKGIWPYPEVPNALMSPLFQAATECTEEAIYNSLTMATAMTGNGVTVEALPLNKVMDLIKRKLSTSENTGRAIS
jgi:D-aminopeptidase